MAEKPVIRYAEFTDTWEQRKLEEYIKTSQEKNEDNKFGKQDVLSVSGDVGIVNQIEFQGRSFAGVSVANYGVVHHGDVVYTKSPLKSNPFGIIKTNQGRDGIVSTLYAVYKPKENTDSRFVQIYFENDYRLNHYLHPLVNKGAKNDMKISADNALKGLVVFPSSKDEQAQISDLFAEIGHLFTLHQHEFDKMVSIKKAMLEKMFPKTGENKPEIRFAGFTDAWEQRKVDELAEQCIGGGTPSTTKSEYWNGSLPWIQSSDLTENILFNVAPRKRITEAGLLKSATKLVAAGSIAVITRVGVGKLAYMPYVYATSQDFLSLSKLKADGQFVVYALYQMIQKELHNVQGTSIKGITKDELLQKTVIIPRNSDEQAQIGKFFHSLDNLITLHQRELEKLQNIKKALLEKMFV